NLDSSDPPATPFIDVFGVEDRLPGLWIELTSHAGPAMVVEDSSEVYTQRFIQRLGVRPEIHDTQIRFVVLDFAGNRVCIPAKHPSGVFVKLVISARLFLVYLLCSLHAVAEDFVERGALGTKAARGVCHPCRVATPTSSV